MSIIIVSKIFDPSKNGGGPVKSLRNLVNVLSLYDIKILTCLYDEGSDKPYERISPNKWYKTGNTDIKYLEKFSPASVFREIKAIKPKTLYLNSFFSISSVSFYLLIPLLKNTKIVIAPRGEFNNNALKLKKFKKQLFIKFCKRSLIFKNIIFHATSQSEKEDIEKIFSKNKIIIIKNLPSKETNTIERKEKIPNKLDIVSIGRISRMKNIDFAIRSLLPINEFPINLDLYGPIEDKVYFNELKQIISDLPDNIKVNFNGKIDNEEVSKILPKYDLYFSPTRGENFGHSIIEAIQNHIPVLISDNTPWKNLMYKKVGVDLSLDNISDYTEMIYKLTKMNDEEYKTLFYDFNSFLINELNIDKTINEYKRLLNLEEDKDGE